MLQVDSFRMCASCAKMCHKPSLAALFNLEAILQYSMYVCSQNMFFYSHVNFISCRSLYIINVWDFPFFDIAIIIINHTATESHVYYHYIYNEIEHFQKSHGPQAMFRRHLICVVFKHFRIFTRAHTYNRFVFSVSRTLSPDVYRSSSVIHLYLCFLPAKEWALFRAARHGCFIADTKKHLKKSTTKSTWGKN